MTFEPSKLMPTESPIENPWPLTVTDVPGEPCWGLKAMIVDEDVWVASVEVTVKVAVAMLFSGPVAVTVYMPGEKPGTVNTASTLPNIPVCAAATFLDPKLMLTEPVLKPSP
jgi:hypothetical protein